MALPSADAILAMSLAALNITLAIVLLQVRPQRAANLFAAGLFGANGLVALAPVLMELGVTAPALAISAAIAQRATLIPLLALPLLLPHRRMRVPLIAASVLAGSAIVTLDLFFVLTASEVPPPPWADALYVLLYNGAPALGAFLFLDDLLHPSSARARKQVAVLLAAYVLKLCVLVPSPALLPVLGQPTLVASIGPFAARVALVAVVALILVSRLRGRAARPWAFDLAILACVPLGWGISQLGTDGPLEYLLLRPLLFSYAILQTQLFDIDERARRAAASGLVVALVLGALTLGLLAAVPAAVVLGGVAAAAIALAARPLHRRAEALFSRAFSSQPSGKTERQKREVYRAALEAAIAGGLTDDTKEERILATLRAQLGISDREHALMEAAIRSDRDGASGPSIGRVFLGRYRVVRVLGEGGFGRAFLVRDIEVERDAVLKVARASSSRDAERVMREARLTAALGHPNVVTVYDVERVGDEVVLVLEYLAGGTLADRLAAGPVPPAEATRIMDEILAALEAAHAAGILHRDVKPENVLFTKDGRAKLTDFGIALAFDGSGTASGLAPASSHPGTLAWMSPEQVRGGATLDARSDIFAAGAILYRMLSGRHYLDLRGRADLEARLAILEEPPLTIEPGSPLVDLCLYALAKEPDARPASAAEMRRRLATAASTLV